MFSDILADINQILHELNAISTAFRILLAMIMGGILGLEREFKNRPAGFRTYMLVCIGSTMVMITNQYIYQTFETFDVDPARMGAQVISGIGFLGAGTIIVTRRNQIKGLTTAAGLWAAGCLGLAIGVGFYSGAIIGGTGVSIAMMGLHRINDKIRSGGKLIEVYIEFNGVANVSSFMNYLKIHNLEVKDLSINKGQLLDNENIALVITLQTQVKTHHASIIQLLSQAEGVQFIEEI